MTSFAQETKNDLISGSFDQESFEQFAKKIEELQQQRIFYSPDYATEDKSMSRLPDFRNLLFWSPVLNTDENGKAAFSFYTGDIPGKYLAVVQGLAANGYAGSASFILNVGR